jgi:hypothetical protein
MVSRGMSPRLARLFTLALLLPGCKGALSSTDSDGTDGTDGTGTSDGTGAATGSATATSSDAASDSASSTGSPSSSGTATGSSSVGSTGDATASATGSTSASTTGTTGATSSTSGSTSSGGSTGPGLPAECTLIPESGGCFAQIPRFYFNTQSGTCESFMWGGCDGVVPFETFADCLDTCPDPKPASCGEEGVSGPCAAAFEKWEYDPVEGNCVSFTWGGCDGNVPYDEENDCESACE